MSDDATAAQTGVIITTSTVAFISGFLLGIYALRGYLISPALTEQRRRNFEDPVESDESDVDETDTLLDHAPNWVNGPDADRRDGLTAAKKSASATAQHTNGGNDRQSSWKDSTEECKLVLVVRTDLGMTKGKIAAQCGHATLACYKSLLHASRKSPESVEARVLSRWEKLGQAKIAVQVKSEEEMDMLMETARSLGVTVEDVHDAGRTQIQAGSRTVLGVGPAPKSVVDVITGHLKLL